MEADRKTDTAEKQRPVTPPKRAAVPRPEKKALSERFIPGRTKCKFCSATVAVRHTDNVTLGNGDILITRRVKCNGDKRHCYDHEDIVPASKAKK